MVRSIDDSDIQEKIFIIKEFILEGKTLEEISAKMRKMKNYNILGFDDFMKRNSEGFKDIGFVRRKEKRKWITLNYLEGLAQKLN